MKMRINRKQNESQSANPSDGAELPLLDGEVERDAGLEAYLDQLCAPLRRSLSKEAAQNLRTEMREHLLDQVEAFQEEGKARDAALTAAMEQFGDGDAFIAEWRAGWKKLERAGLAHSFRVAVPRMLIAAAASFAIAVLIHLIRADWWVSLALGVAAVIVLPFAVGYSIAARCPILPWLGVTFIGYGLFFAYTCVMASLTFSTPYYLNTDGYAFVWAFSALQGSGVEELTRPLRARRAAIARG